MIVPFAVDPDALVDVDGDLAVRRANHRRLVKLWHRLGALVYCDGPSSTFTDVISAIPDPDVRKLWEVAWRHNRRQSVCDAGWPDLRNVCGLSDLDPLKAFVSLACLDTVRAVVLGLPEQELSLDLDNGTFELCRFDTADQAHVFDRAQAMSNASIEGGTSAEQVWRERFAGLARFSSHVVVVDPYCLNRHINVLDSRGHEWSGLRRLLTELDATGLKHSVTVYTMIDEHGRWDGERARNVWAAEWKRMSRGGVKQLKLRLGLKPQAFKRIAHDRFIRFDTTLVNLGCGLEALEGKVVSRRSSFSAESCMGDTGIEKALLGRTLQVDYPTQYPSDR